MHTPQTMPQNGAPFTTSPPNPAHAGDTSARAEGRPPGFPPRDWSEGRDRRPGELALGRVLGTPVSFHWNWLLLLALVGWPLAVGYFPFVYRRQPPAAYWALGAFSVALLCASVLAHELAHAVVARRNGIPVRGITFFAFRGAAQILGQPRTPGAEFRVAVVGPLTSLGLAVLFAAARLTGTMT